MSVTIQCLKRLGTMGRNTSFNTFTWCYLSIVFPRFQIIVNNCVSIESISLWNIIGDSVYHGFSMDIISSLVEWYWFRFLYTSRVPQMFLIGFKYGLKAGPSETLTFWAESRSFLLCKLLMEELECWNRYDPLSCHYMELAVALVVYLATLLNFVSHEEMTDMFGHEN